MCSKISNDAFLRENRNLNSIIMLERRLRRASPIPATDVQGGGREEKKKKGKEEERRAKKFALLGTVVGDAQNRMVSFL